MKWHENQSFRSIHLSSTHIILIPNYQKSLIYSSHPLSSNQKSTQNQSEESTESSCVIATHISSVDFLIIDHIRFFIVGGAYIIGLFVLVKRERKRERKLTKNDIWREWGKN